MTFLFAVRDVRRDVTLFIQESGGVELLGVGAVDPGVSIKMPDVGDDNCSGGYEISFIPVVL